MALLIAYVSMMRVLADEIRKYIREIAPEKEKIVKFYKNSLPIFDNFGINKQIKALFGQTVSYKHGAYLIIEHTEALHVIDVKQRKQIEVW